MTNLEMKLAWASRMPLFWKSSKSKTAIDCTPVSSLPCRWKRKVNYLSWTCYWENYILKFTGNRQTLNGLNHAHQLKIASFNQIIHPISLARVAKETKGISQMVKLNGYSKMTIKSVLNKRKHQRNLSIEALNTSSCQINYKKEHAITIAGTTITVLLAHLLPSMSHHLNMLSPNLFRF